MNGRLWNADTGEPIGAEIEIPKGFAGAAFSVDSPSIFIAGRDGSVQLRGVEDGSLIASPLMHPAELRGIALHPSGNFLLAGCIDGSAWLWDLKLRRTLGAPMVQSAPLEAVAFSQDGTRCLSLSRHEGVRSWPMPSGINELDIQQLKLQLEVQTAVQFIGNDVVMPLSSAEWQSRREQLGEYGSAVPIALGTPLDKADWHEARARDAEQDHNWFAARWHLDRLIELDPNNWLLHARRARTRSSEQQFRQAASDYAHAKELLGQQEYRINNWYRQRLWETNHRQLDEVAAWYEQRWTQPVASHGPTR